MTKLLAGLSAGTVALVLLVAFAGHLRDRRALRDALAAHRILPPSLRAPVAVAVTALEGLLGALTGAALVDGRASPVLLGGTGAAALFAGYAVYGWYVLRTRPRVPCGCASDGTPMSGWVVGRAGALAVLSVTAAAGSVPATSSNGAHAAIVSLVSMVFAVLLWLLPTAMFDPEGSTTR